MKKILVLVVLFFFVCFAQTPIEKTSNVLKNKLSSVSDGSKILVWIFFKDKGKSLNKFYSVPKNVVSELSLKRRAKVLDKSSLIDYTDLPVYNDYISKLQSEGFELKQISKWFNGVSGYITKKQFDNVVGLSFVDKADVVSQLKKSSEIKESKLDLNKVSPINKPTGVNSLDYGLSLGQLQQINVPALHNMGYKGQGVTICVMDAGVSLLSHEAFDSLKIVATYDFVNHRKYIGNDSGGYGEGSHGTMTLSLIGGFKPGQIIGPAYGSNYILAKTENTSSESPIEEDNWIAAMEWADSIGVEVTSTSLGYLAFDDTVAAQLDYTWQNMDGRTTIITEGAVLAARKGICVVNSAGNEGDDPTHNTLDAPADADSIITAGAVTIGGVRSSFSSVGNTVDGRTKPDVMALGSGDYVANPYITTGYSTGSGTSFSCPLIAGVCAQLLSFNHNLTPIQIREALRNTASQNTAPDRHMGWGIIDALVALNYAQILSVELSSFTANQIAGGVELQWTTSTEVNFSFFEIEKKRSDNETWQSISSIKASGNSSNSNKYTFIDKNTALGKYNYRLKIVDSNGTFKYSIIVEVNVSSPNYFILYQNYPNPFNPNTNIKYYVPQDSNVKIKLYNILGRQINTIYNGFATAGDHELTLDASKLSSGVYFVNFSAGDYQKSIKITLIK